MKKALEPFAFSIVAKGYADQSSPPWRDKALFMLMAVQGELGQAWASVQKLKNPRFCTPSCPSLDRGRGNRALYRILPFLLFPLLLLLSACSSELNDPYPKSERGQNILYTAFTERPKHLDPAQSYVDTEGVFLYQIYEPPLQYHFLKRPYELIPNTLVALPNIRYFDAKNQVLPYDAPISSIAFSEYELELRPQLLYQPHPAFARDDQGRLLYHALLPEDLQKIETLRDFEKQGTQVLRAQDYVYQIKRLADPSLLSPAFSVLSPHIVGFKNFSETLQRARKEHPKDLFLDLDTFELEGVKALDDHRFTIRVHGKYPQFSYWLAMTFFSPIPKEVDRFYQQKGMTEKNLSLNWYPVGTGPYQLTDNDPNAKMVLSKNPNFHGETYPCEGEAKDRVMGLLSDCGAPLPQIDKVVFTREPESLPYWNKFLQGYYDASGIASDSFDQAISMNAGAATLSPEMVAQGITLHTSVRASTFYWAFNLEDPLLGGQTPEEKEHAKKLRQALSIAFDQEEFISIFLNGRADAAMSPLPPEIFGRKAGKEGMNPVVYDWYQGRAKRKPIEAAQKLLTEAGYREGRDPKTGAPLVLYLDMAGGGAGEKAQMDWIVRQFAKLNVQLIIRATDFNRFQEKLRQGNTQIAFLGWGADYPDPENFFFLLLSQEARIKGGENSANYQNPAFDRLFAQMKSLDNGKVRQAFVDEMVAMVQEDAPWLFGLHPKSYQLLHAWVFNRKPSALIQNSLKYQRIDVAAREAARQSWNRPVLSPLWGAAFIVFVFVLRFLHQKKKNSKRPRGEEGNL